MAIFADNTWFFTETCCNCGMRYAMTQEFHDRMLKDRTRFFCPAGHGQSYTGDTTEQRLKRELERQKQMLEAAQAREAKAENERQQIAKAHHKMRVRVMNGVCPCCNRTFQNLLSHMKTKHPDFREKLTLKALRETFGMNQATVAKEAGVNTAYVSAYERDRYVPEYAKVRLDGWVSRHESKGTVP